MSKIICDVCGTSYQDSAMQCPICGCARPIEMNTEPDSDGTALIRSEKYTYVKGGRFSRANVQKRNRNMLHNDINETHETETDFAPLIKNSTGDKGLVVAVCALLLAIVAVVIYIVVHFFSPAEGNGSASTMPQLTNAPNTTVTTTADSVSKDIPCDELTLSLSEVTLLSAGDNYTIEPILNPADTTNEVLFTTDDESVASVSQSGEVTAIASGDTIIKVICGDKTAQLHVICSFEEEPSQESQEPTVESTSEPTGVVGTFKAPYKINKTDVSISVGESFQLKLTDATGEIIPVTWSATIEDICSIDGVVITGAMKGKTEVSVTYDGETYTCIVRVR